MCGQDSVYSATTNPSFLPSNSNQINAMSSSLVAGSGFLTDRQVHADVFNMFTANIFVYTYTYAKKIGIFLIK